MSEWKSNRVHRHHLPQAVLGFDWRPQNPQVGWVGCLDGVYRLNLENGESSKLYEHESYVSGVRFYPERQLVVSSGYDGQLIWFDLARNEILRQEKLFDFWCWSLAGNDGMLETEDAAAIEARLVVGSGQYLAGDYEYHPQKSEQSTVKVVDVESGTTLTQFPFLPPVQAVGISADGKWVAAANLMGDVSVWNVEEQKQVATWNTPDFTAFGIIKSHCQIGGIYSLMFTNDLDVIVCGMGPMRDPMAGNGKQRWQRFTWKDRAEPVRISASKDDQVGEGLMETLAFAPDQKTFVMAGRLRGGAWSTGIFNLESSDLLHSIKSDSRVTTARFNDSGDRLFLAGAINQSADPNHKFGVVDVFDIQVTS